MAKPQPSYVCGVAQPGAQFVQLEVREVAMARCERFVQGLCVRALRESTRWRWWLVVAEEPVLRRKGPAQRLAQTALSRFVERGFQTVQGSVASSTESGSAGLTAKGLDRSTWPCVPSLPEHACERPVMPE